MTESRWPLSPRAARVFYNLADAWIPAEGAHPGGGDVDVVAGLDGRLRTPSERRRLERALWLLEWSPRFALRSRRGLCWMPRSARRAWLERLAQSRVQAIADGVAWLHELVAASHRDVASRCSPPGDASAPSASGPAIG